MLLKIQLAVAVLLSCILAHPAIHLEGRPEFTEELKKLRESIIREEELLERRAAPPDEEDPTYQRKKERMESLKNEKGESRRRALQETEAPPTDDDEVPFMFEEALVSSTKSGLGDKLMYFELNDSGLELLLWIDLQGKTHIDLKKNGTGEQWQITETLEDRTNFNYTNSEGQRFSKSGHRQSFLIDKLVTDPTNSSNLIPQEFTPEEELTLTNKNCCVADHYHVDLPVSSTEFSVPSIGLFLWSKEVNRNTEPADLYNYEMHGADWGDDFPHCDQPMQGPIELLPPITHYGNTYSFFSFEEDEFRPEYVDVKDAELYTFSSIQSMEMYITHDLGFQGFSSKIGQDLFGAPLKWQAYELLFKRKSEHTLQEKRFDLELQIFHTPYYGDIDKVAASKDPSQQSDRRQLQGRELVELEFNDTEVLPESHYEIREQTVKKFDFAVIGILFDTEDYDKSLSPEEVQFFYDFFDQMDYEQNSTQLIERLEFRKLMANLEFSERWIYKASMPVPPCHQWVYWNVLQKVYPIRKDQVESIQRGMELAGISFSDGLGNVRQTDPLFNKEVYFVKSSGMHLSISLLLLGALLIHIAW